MESTYVVWKSKEKESSLKGWSQSLMIKAMEISHRSKELVEGGDLDLDSKEACHVFRGEEELSGFRFKTKVDQEREKKRKTIRYGL